jgi:hypothetical protein
MGTSELQQQVVRALKKYLANVTLRTDAPGSLLFLVIFAFRCRRNIDELPAAGEVAVGARRSSERVSDVTGIDDRVVETGAAQRVTAVRYVVRHIASCRATLRYN